VRSQDAGDVLRYQFGPGDDGEHHDQRLVAAWAMAAVGGLGDPEPERLPGGGVSVARLASLLEQPVVAGVNPPARPVRHCSVHNHASDPELPDGLWAQIAAEFVDAVGLAPTGDLGAVRWVAVRHGGDHVHRPGQRPAAVTGGRADPAGAPPQRLGGRGAALPVRSGRVLRPPRAAGDHGPGQTRPRAVSTSFSR
jgi:hypothetical protein